WRRRASGGGLNPSDDQTNQNTFPRECARTSRATPRCRRNLGFGCAWLAGPKGGLLVVSRSTSFGDLGADLPASRSTILLVEDDAAVAFMLTDVLESTGYEVLVAGTGATARAQVEQHRPDLIILDLVLPDEDGLVLCSVLKSTVNVPILVCSGTQRR